MTHYWIEIFKLGPGRWGRIAGGPFATALAAREWAIAKHGGGLDLANRVRTDHLPLVGIEGQWRIASPATDTGGDGDV